MKVDYLRRCYRTTMQLWNDPDADPTPVRWFWAEDDAKWLPFATPFRSRDSDREGKLGDDTPLPFLGETQFGGSYQLGSNRPRFLGQDSHGDGAAWLLGGEPGIDAPLVTDENGSLPGCIAIEPFELSFDVGLAAGEPGYLTAGVPFAATLALGTGTSLAEAGEASLGMPLPLATSALLSQAARGNLHAAAALQAALLSNETAGHRFAPLFALLVSFSPTQVGKGALAMTNGLTALLTALTEGEANLLVALALKAQGEGLTDAEASLAESLALKAGVQIPGTGIGHTGPANAGKLSVSMSFSAVNVQPKPAGACGQLPNTCVVRFSGGTGTFAAWNGASSNMTYNSGSGQWTGTAVVGGNNNTVTVPCIGSSWNCTVSGPSGTGGPDAFSGTSGANPNLTATVHATGGSTGSMTATLTRN